MKNNFVTVYMPTHNRVELLARAVDSVLNQTFKNIELIVCDDGSSDNTWKYLSNISKIDSRVKILRNEFPQGACFSRNRCISEATGTFITGLDDDDYFTQDRIEIFINYAQTQDLEIISSNLIYKNKNSEEVGESIYGNIDYPMLGYRNIIGNQIFCKTKYLKEIGGFDINAPAWQDYDLWFRLVRKYGSCFRIRETTYVMDIGHDNPRITKGSKAYKGYLYFIEKHRNTLNKKNLKSLFIEDMRNRGQPIKFSDIVKNFTLDVLKSYLKDKLKRNVPLLSCFLDYRKRSKINNL